MTLWDDVVRCTINGVIRYFHTNNNSGSANYFSLFDGNNKVGEGVLSAS